MVINNGLVFEANGSFSKKDVVIYDNKIEGFENADNTYAHRIIDATNMYVIPGLIDIHFHGCKGYDFCDGTKESLEKIAKYELSCGITSICPASMTFDEKKLQQIFQNASTYDNDDGARLVGINMEGPFISKSKIGAQNPDFIHKPDVDMFDRLQKAANGLIKLVDIAPEEDGALDFIKEVSGNVQVSIAHTAANYETTMKAFENGARHVTHLYNAMLPFLHRNPGVIGAAVDDERVLVELIVDGIHVEGPVVRATFKMFDDDRIIFISDSMEATGMPDGMYELGGQRVNVQGKVARLEDGTIAGSVTNLMNCIKTAVNQMNVPLGSAIKCSTVNPAKSIGIYDKYGSIEVGKIADIVILDKNLEIMAVIKDGKEVQNLDFA